MSSRILAETKKLINKSVVESAVLYGVAARATSILQRAKPTDTNRIFQKSSLKSQEKQTEEYGNMALNAYRKRCCINDG